MKMLIVITVYPNAGIIKYEYNYSIFMFCVENLHHLCSASQATPHAEYSPQPQLTQHQSHFQTQLRFQCLFHAITYFIQSFYNNL
jgi:hypothetical protein